MPVHVDITVDAAGAEELVKDAADRLSDFSPMFRGSFREALQDFFEREWESEGRAGGTFWPPISEGTRKAREERGIASRKPLWATGRLRQSFIRTGPDNLFEVTPMSMTWGSTLSYARTHQYPFAFAPSRPIVPDVLPQTAVREFEHVLLAWISAGKT